MNFANFQLFAKIFQRKFSTQGVQCARAAVHEIVPTKSSKITIRENLDPRKFSAIWYAFCNVIGALKFESGSVPSDKNVTTLDTHT